MFLAILTKLKPLLPSKAPRLFRSHSQSQTLSRPLYRRKNLKKSPKLNPYLGLIVSRKNHASGVILAERMAPNRTATVQR